MVHAHNRQSYLTINGISLKNNKVTNRKYTAFLLHIPYLESDYNSFIWKHAFVVGREGAHCSPYGRKQSQSLCRLV